MTFWHQHWLPQVTRGGAARRKFPVLAGLLALVLTALLSWTAHNRFLAEREDRLANAAERIERRIFRNGLLLRAMQGFFVAEGGEVTRDQLRAFLDSLPVNTALKGAQGFGFALGVPADSPDAATDRIRAAYGIERAPWPATSEPIRYPIVLLEPHDRRNAAAIGYDMYSEPIRRAAMRKAAETRQAAVTPPLRLVQELDDGGQLGFLVYIPVFSRGAPPAGDGKPQPIGFVYAPFRIGDLISAVVGGEKNARIQVRVYYGPVAPKNLIYSNADTIVAPVKTNIRMDDADWTFLIGEAGDRGGWNSPALLILALGAAFAAALAAFGFQQARRMEATERLAVEVARNAEQKEILLQEMGHRIKNSIARILALFRLTVRETKDPAALARDFERRLQAMANAQSLLVAGSGGVMSLRDLFAQAAPDLPGGKRVVADSAPDLPLDEQQAQALGLVIHEWATNSLKYGALACGGTLRVDWRVEQAPDGPVVRLDWIEKGLDRQPDFSKPGFGSRLARAMVEGSLGGEVSHEIFERALAMRLTFPLSRPLAMQA